MNATGPRTPEGKAQSSQNATKHGLRSERPIVPGEDPAEWDNFRDNIVKDLEPGNTIEHELAERIALQMWRLRRAARYEAEVAEDDFEQAKHELTGTIMGLHGDDAATNSIKEMKRCVDYAKAQLNLAETTLDTARRLAKLQDHAILDTLVAITLLQVAGCPIPETREPVPTAGEVRHILASGLHMSQKDALARAIDAAEQRRVEAEKEIPFQERRLDMLLDDVTRRAEANMRDQRLLHDKALDRVVRYEAHVSRQLNQARQMLRELKAERLAKEAARTMENEKPHRNGRVGTAETSFGNRIGAMPDLPEPGTLVSDESSLEVAATSASSFGSSHAAVPTMPPPDGAEEQRGEFVRSIAADRPARNGAPGAEDKHE